MIRLGKVYSNLMVDVQATNAKLRRRAVRLVEEATGVDATTAQHGLAESHNDVKVAIAVVRLGLSPDEARKRLVQAGGHLRTVLGET
jgi:N-acetylmuramic acid 6-phosphate etherase